MTTKSIYFESLQGDVRKRYHEKTSLINGDPYMMAKREVSKDRVARYNMCICNVPIEEIPWQQSQICSVYGNYIAISFHQLQN